MKKKRKHKTESRKREIIDTFCIQKGCKFEGELAAQGVCFSRLKKIESDYVGHALKQGEEFLAEAKALRKRNKQGSTAKWTKYLEGHIVCTWANNVFAIDELIHLRAENAKLRLQLGKWRKPK